VQEHVELVPNVSSTFCPFKSIAKPILASADRRPVDPPPVVELQVFEDGRDVTFGYNANFFLFATLEAARTMAVPRGQPVTSPVLTGVPVAGMAYLDRPKQAGYFIFPDLSVRHEGHYRLSFNLFEEIKDPKDEDATPAMPQPNEQPLMSQSSTTSGPQSFLNFRLLVRSRPFQVFSAKKFPGLCESTQLSRMVAEQGCRVRIRRDVRMRRRDGPHGKGEYMDEEGRVYQGPDRTATPGNYGPPMSERARSVSRGSMDAPHGYPANTSRRASLTDIGQYHTGYHTPQTPAPPPPLLAGFPLPSQAQSHLSFGAPPTPQFGMPHPPQALPPVGPSVPQNNGYPHHQSPLTRQPPIPPVYRYPSPQHFANRSDTPVATPKQEYSQTLSMGPNGYGAYNHNSNAAQPTTPSLPQAQMPNLSLTVTSNRTLKQELPPIAVFQEHLAGIKNSPIVLNAFGTADDRIGGPASNGPYDPIPRPSKRNFGVVFSDDLDRPLHNGMRTDDHSHDYLNPILSANDFDHDPHDTSLMQYKRADGQPASKAMPPSSPAVATYEDPSW
jgi:hypothetical protein